MTVPEILRMPEIAANTAEAMLASWLVRPRSRFAAGDALATVETEKAAVDVPAEADGVLLRVLVPEGRQVAVGTPIALWGSGAEGDDEVEALASSLTAGGDSARAPTAPGAPAGGPPDAGRVFASPLARRLARDAGLDLAGLVGSGPNGRIRRADIEAHLARAGTGETASRPPARAVATTPAAPYEDQPVSRMRQAIARRLTESKQTAPHFYLRGSARVDRLLALREEVNAADAGARVSVNDLLVKAVARAHELVPALNVQWNGESIRRFGTVDVGVAIATDDGLLTPVVRDVPSLSLRRLAETTQDLARRAAERRIAPAELEGGSVTVTNLGMFGVEEFAAIINPPQAAILAVGAARPEPVVAGGALAVGTVLRVTLAVDHRPVDGAAAAGWMRTFLGLLERPAQILT